MPHQVQKLTLDFRLSAGSQIENFQKRLQSLSQTQLETLLNHALEYSGLSQEDLTIKKLELDLGALPPALFESEFQKQLPPKFIEALLEFKKEQNLKKPQKKVHFSTFHNFFSHGFDSGLIFSGSLKSSYSNFLAFLNENPQESIPFQEKLEHNRVLVQRLIYHFTDHELKQMFSRLPLGQSILKAAALLQNFFITIDQMHQSDWVAQELRVLLWQSILTTALQIKAAPSELTLWQTVATRLAQTEDSSIIQWIEIHAPAILPLLSNHPEGQLNTQLDHSDLAKPQPLFTNSTNTEKPSTTHSQRQTTKSISSKQDNRLKISEAQSTEETNQSNPLESQQIDASTTLSTSSGETKSFNETHSVQTYFEALPLSLTVATPLENRESEPNSVASEFTEKSIAEINDFARQSVLETYASDPLPLATPVQFMATHETVVQSSQKEKSIPLSSQIWTTNNMDNSLMEFSTETDNASEEPSTEVVSKSTTITLATPSTTVFSFQLAAIDSKVASPSESKLTKGPPEETAMGPSSQSVVQSITTASARKETGSLSGSPITTTNHDDSTTIEISNKKISEQLGIVQKTEADKVSTLSGKEITFIGSLQIEENTVGSTFPSSLKERNAISNLNYSSDNQASPQMPRTNREADKWINPIKQSDSSITPEKLHQMQNGSMGQLAEGPNSPNATSNEFLVEKFNQNSTMLKASSHSPKELDFNVYDPFFNTKSSNSQERSSVTQTSTIPDLKQFSPHHKAISQQVVVLSATTQESHSTLASTNHGNIGQPKADLTANITLANGVNLLRKNATNANVIQESSKNSIFNKSLDIQKNTVLQSIEDKKDALDLKAGEKTLLTLESPLEANAIGKQSLVTQAQPITAHETPIQLSQAGKAISSSPQIETTNSLENSLVELSSEIDNTLAKSSIKMVSKSITVVLAAPPTTAMESSHSGFQSITPVSERKKTGSLLESPMATSNPDNSPPIEIPNKPIFEQPEIAQKTEADKVNAKPEDPLLNKTGASKQETFIEFCTQQNASKAKIPGNTTFPPDSVASDHHSKNIIKTTKLNEKSITTNEHVKSEPKENILVKSPLTNIPTVEIPEAILRQLKQSTIVRQQKETEIAKEQKSQGTSLNVLAQRAQTHSTLTPWRKHQETPLEVNNAGLVLLGTFLPQYFNSLGLTNDDGFHDRQSQIRAIHCAQYLIWGSKESAEEDLLLNKILCGMEVEAPIPIQWQLDDNERNESENLLKAVIGLWTILKNTSPKAMQTSILQRKGFLIERDESWELTLEPTSLDILLEYLPWGYRMHHFTWMSKLLVVE